MECYLDFLFFLFFGEEIIVFFFFRVKFISRFRISRIEIMIISLLIIEGSQGNIEYNWIEVYSRKL